MSLIAQLDEPVKNSTNELVIIARIRLIVAVGTLLNVVIDPTGLGNPYPTIFLLLCIYTAQSLAVSLLSENQTKIIESKLVHWLDVFWFSLLLALAGPMTPFFFLFFFAISTASFRCGYDEGARVTLACAALYIFASSGLTNDEQLASVMLRSVFLLGLGYMVAHWGDLLLTHKRQIALLRDVSKVSNPRFGVEQTISSVLGNTLEYFHATTCMLLTREQNANTWRLRTASDGEGIFATGQYVLDDALAAPLMSLPAKLSAAFCAPALTLLPWRGKFFIRDHACTSWQKACPSEGRRLADLLGARSFICVGVMLDGEEGRMFVLAQRSTLGNADASFLDQVASQAFPVIENIRLLDKMASEAARREREKFSNDLHDTTMQCYIGLSHALQSLLRQTDEDNPIASALQQVAEMANQFTCNLRQFSRDISNPSLISDEPALARALRAYAADNKKYFDLDITISGHEMLSINDRLGAEVFQLVSEGLSNIRRHTLSRRGAVELRCDDDWLQIRICNDSQGNRAVPFVPRSISQRASSLGGFANVATLDDVTVVDINIPI